MNARKIVFHAAYYGNYSEKGAYKETKLQLEEILGEIRKNKWSVELAPETTGRASQFGTLGELLQMAEELECSFCVDVAHLYARNQGKIDYAELFERLEGRRHVHFQFSGVEFGRSGEKRHLVLNGSPDFRTFAEELLTWNMDATIISESPITWEDSLKMKEILEELGHKF